jgi:hypothetical protein
VVSTGRGRGYTEHNFSRGGRNFTSRTYYRGGHAYARAYGRGYWHGGYYNHYYPGRFWGGGYYGWAYGGWGPGIGWGWGWGGAPWFGYYGYFFNPYPVYAAPAFWLTDYLISQNLQAAYAAQAAANATVAANASAGGDPGGAPADSGGGAQSAVVLTPEVKQAIADEVKAEIAAERDAAAAQASAPAAAAPAADSSQSASATPAEVPPDALNPNLRTFIVADTLNPQLADGTECSLSQGDVLTRIDDTPDANQNVKVLVSGSQKGDCSSGSQFAVSVNDLQEMHNHFREQIDDGLGELAKNQGKNGMPAAPAGSTVSKPNPDGVAQVDPNAAADLAKQQQEADATEKEVQVAANDGVSN